jgi:hypothetical protein
MTRPRPCFRHSLRAHVTTGCGSCLFRRQMSVRSVLMQHSHGLSDTGSFARHSVFMQSGILPETRSLWSAETVSSDSMAKDSLSACEPAHTSQRWQRLPFRVTRVCFLSTSRRMPSRATGGICIGNRIHCTVLRLHDHCHTLTSVLSLVTASNSRHYSASRLTSSHTCTLHITPTAYSLIAVS